MDDKKQVKSTAKVADTATNEQAVKPSNTNAFAVTALVTGIVGIALSWIPFINFFSFILAILAIIFGAIATHRKAGGKAIAGLALGVITMAIMIIIWITAAMAVNKLTNELDNAVKNSTIKLDTIDGSSYTIKSND